MKNHQWVRKKALTDATQTCVIAEKKGMLHACCFHTALFNLVHFILFVIWISLGLLSFLFLFALFSTVVAAFDNIILKKKCVERAHWHHYRYRYTENFNPIFGQDSFPFAIMAICNMHAMFWCHNGYSVMRKCRYKKEKRQKSIVPFKGRRWKLCLS